MFLVIFGLQLIQHLHGSLFHESRLTGRELYDKIDAYLSESVRTDDVEANLAAAERWLKELEHKLGKWYKHHSSTTKQLVGAIRVFVAQREVLASGQCDDWTLGIIDANSSQAGLQRSLTLSPPKRRIEKVIHECARKYYRTCYPDTIGPKLAKLSLSSLDGLMFLATIRDSPDGYNSGAINYVQMIRDRVAADSQQVRTTGKLNSGHKKHQVTVEEYKAYVLRPCLELEEKMGEEFQVPISLSITHYDLEHDELAHVYRKRRALRHCQFVLKNREKLWLQMLEAMVAENEREKMEAIHKLSNDNKVNNYALSGRLPDVNREAVAEAFRSGLLKRRV